MNENNGLLQFSDDALLSGEVVMDWSARRLGLEKDLQSIAKAMPKGSTFTYRIENDTVALRVLRVQNTRVGSGTVALSAIVEALDRWSFRAAGLVDPTDDPNDPCTSTLVGWYERFGFQVTGYDVHSEQPLIERLPQIQVDPMVRTHDEPTLGDACPRSRPARPG